jgi:hypothetical protein
MFEIPNMSLDTARDELGADFARRIDVDFKHSKCIWRKAGGTKTKKNNHSLMDCPTTKPAENDQTSLSNEIFNAGEGDAAIAYIHQKQLSMYPRDDNATTFSTGFPRSQMPNCTVSVKTTPAPPSASSGPSSTPITPVPSPKPPGGPAIQGMLSSVVLVRHVASKPFCGNTRMSMAISLRANQFNLQSKNTSRDVT